MTQKNQEQEMNNQLQDDDQKQDASKNQAHRPNHSADNEDDVKAYHADSSEPSDGSGIKAKAASSEPSDGSGKG